ncbi:MAG: NgoPII family restriction endonuclease [Clostridia bacterium]
MKTNILKAIINIVDNPVNELKSYYENRNRANSMGGALEEYIKDIFAGTVTETDEAKRLKILEDVFSYQGNQNNPPDSMIRNGDAIEVKKIESKNSLLALNSSYPKAKIFSNSTMITTACRNCEEWTEKDIIYAVGVVSKEGGKEGKHFSNLSMVYGVDYAASAEIYERIKTVISDGVNSITDVEFAQTNELGRVNRVDPLGITYLRIRGMWGIENPIKTFSYLNPFTNNQPFQLMAIINDEKYYSFPRDDINHIEQLTQNTNLKIIDVEIKTPDNPSNLKKAKLITFWRS